MNTNNELPKNPAGEYYLENVRKATGETAENISLS
jgi:hypothetical protein